MNKNSKTRLYTVLFFLAALCFFILWGIWGPAYDWFTGTRLAVIFALGTMIAHYLEAAGNANASFMKIGFCAMTFLIGSHLLTPYFWPGRIADHNVFVVFWLTAGLAWLLLLSLMKETKRDDFFKIFCEFPVVLFIGSMLPVYVDSGSIYAPALLCVFYFIEGALLVHKGVAEKDRGLFNCGLVLFCFLLIAYSLSFLFALPTPVHIIVVLLLIVFLNVLFKKF